MASTSVPRDVLEFLEDYPHSDGDDSDCNANLKFYSNKLRCRPDGLLIDELHNQWEGDYETLERKHGFIQWLFPIQEYGLNYESQPLQRHEITSMKGDPLIIQRIVASYRLMLDFYGLRLVDPDTGLLDRTLPPRDSPSRFKNLVYSFHNYLRITRILKCLSEFGLERLNAGFLLCILNEQSENNELNGGALKNSMDRWWANCIRDEGDRRFVRKVIGRVRDGQITWTRANYEEALKSRKELGHFE
ncbi:opioid growth factor receptor conserved region-domain-containing protein [Hysterangium stoloniferum]|nr:opioid growth factor receptor conserved region-domain-containing protein [Hysterangium stoloniferum]